MILQLLYSEFPYKWEKFEEQDISKRNYEITVIYEIYISRLEL